MTQRVYGTEEVECDVCGKTESKTFDISSSDSTSSLEWDLRQTGWGLEGELEHGAEHICPSCQGMIENGWREKKMHEHHEAEWIQTHNEEVVLRIVREYPISREMEFFLIRDENDNIREREKYNIVCSFDSYRESVWGWEKALKVAKEYMKEYPS